ncbi:MAG: hypothetical protein WD055_01840 [Candidatus Dependentiae bacterium]
MKFKNKICCILIIGYTFNCFSAIFDIAYPYTIDKKEFFPWTAFFRSLYARKELALGKYPVKAEISGYVMHEPFWDSRQVDASVSGLQLFAPQPKECDPRGKDINAVGEFSMSPLETRGRAKFYGPIIENAPVPLKFFNGAEIFGLIEFDFIGSNEVLARARARHAYMKLTWKEPEITFWAGQYYHPIRLAHLDLDPKIIGRNRGAPVHPNVRDPQVRFTKGWKNKLNLVLTALTQLRARSEGPEGRSSIYLRRSMMPVFNAQLWLGPQSTKYVFGVGFDIKRLMPRLVTNKCVRTRETITSSAFDIYAKITAEPLSIRTQFVWGQNTGDYGMLGGYAVKTINPRTDERTYANINVMTYWIDFNLDKKISPGLFGGLTKNLGTSTPIIPSITNTKGETESLVYARGPDIKYMAKVNPRIRLHFRPIVFGAEIEWTRAGYGTVKPSGQIENVVPVSNVRFILASYFFF